jgi:hypothetical protein
MSVSDRYFLLGVQEVPGSNPGSPTKRFKRLQFSAFLILQVWGPTGVQTGRQGAASAAFVRIANGVLLGHGIWDAVSV